MSTLAPEHPRAALASHDDIFFDSAERSLRSLPKRDWARIWATLPAQNLPPQLAADLQRSIASGCVDSFTVLTAFGAFGLILVLTALVDLTTPFAQLWTAVHLSKYAMVSVAIWSLRRHRRTGTLSARRVNYTIAIPVLLAGLLWGTLPLTVGNSRDEFTIAISITAVCCIFGFFSTTGHWPFSMTFALLVNGGVAAILWSQDDRAAGLCTFLGSVFIAALFAVSLLTGFSLVRTRYIEARATQREAEAERATERLDTMVELTSGLAHDFNNQLATVMGAVELAASDPALVAPTNQYLNRAIDACLRTRRITADLVVATGYDASYEPARFDATDALRDVAGDLSHTFPAVRMLVRSSGNVWIIADKSHYMRAVQNLIQNACQAILEAEIADGEVIVSIDLLSTISGPVAVTEIVDNGPGVDPAVADWIFKPFATSRRRLGGTGLGLSVAQGFANQAGGSLTMTPTDPGATFTLIIPVAVPLAGPAEPTPSIEAASTHPTKLSGRFLIVDDDQAVAANFCSWIESLGGSAEAVGTVAEAIERYAERSGDLACVISDVVLPDGEGFEVIAALRESNPDLCGVYMSGLMRTLSISVDPKVQCPFVAKPFSFAELIAALEASGVPVRG